MLRNLYPCRLHGGRAADEACMRVTLKCASFLTLSSSCTLLTIACVCVAYLVPPVACQVVSAPTGAGKTGVMELSMLRVLSKHLSPLHGSTAAGASRSSPQQQLQALQALQGRHKLIYLGPIKALIQERQTDWQQRFGGTLGLRCVQLTGDVDDELMDEELEAADIICSTPEKFGECQQPAADHLTCKHKST